ncbi:MAG TPA: hydantoinase B/oxoprolinase family protein, partial [Polyangia bacterium]|nr:hydantoinase B/oxoprolinase family protein [Polyangia bacterium]
IVAARVEVVGPTALAEQVRVPAERVRPRRPAASARAQASFGDALREVSVYERSALAPGDEFEGPAIVCEATATTVVEPGFRARVSERDELLLEDVGAPAAAALSTEVDPVRLEIFNHHFAAIAEQMGLQLARTAGSTNIKERLDFSCALFTAEGDLVVNAPHVPVHLGAMSETVRAVRADNPELAPGDVIVTNDPARGGSHLPDITVVTPVHDEDGQVLFFVASRAHHADVGGLQPGSMPPFSRSLDDEGVVLRNFKLAAGGRSREHELRALLAQGPHPARRIADNLADLAAQVAANQTGAVGLHKVMARHGRPVVLAYMRHIQEAAAAKMRRALARLPPGRHQFADHLDDGTPIAVAITVEGERAIVDFSGTGKVVPGNLNANRAIVTAAVLYCFRCLIAEDIPLNAGVLAPLEIRIPPGSLLDPPANAAVVGGNVETSQRLADVILGALGVAAASQGTMNNLSFGDQSFGYYETVCGGSGATASARGADAVHTHMTNTRLTDAEVLERRYPVRLHRFCIRRGSGGAGAHRGGDGATREIELLRPLDLSILSERRGPYPPFGLSGGAPGALGRNLIWRAGAAAPELLPAKVALAVGPGDRIILETPGGGGFGPSSH